MVAFATAEELGKRMKREFSTEETEWITDLLADATAYLQREIGQQVAPRRSATFSDWPTAGWVDLPQWPVVSVDAVTRDGKDLDYEERPGRIRVSSDEKVDVTFTFGYSTVPRDLVGLCCALVSQQLTLLEANLGLSIGGLSSVAIDDFKIAFADGGDGTGLTLPRVTLDGLRQAYGRGTITQLDVYA